LTDFSARHSIADVSRAPYKTKRANPAWCEIAAGCAVALSVSAAGAYTPDDPEVRQAVTRAAAFLETATDNRLGAKALAARVMFYLDRADDPVVADAVEAARRELAGGGVEESRIYSLGLAVVLLAELNEPAQRELLEGLVAMLVDRQKPHGGWGYPNRPTGDTSMTQYAVYGLWNAGRAGIAVEDRVWRQAIDWLTRTQDPSGGWGYQGNDPGGAALVRQTEVRRSLTEGALASLLLGGERFGLWQFGEALPQVAPQLRPVDVVRNARRPPPFDAARCRTAIEAGVRWDEASPEPIYNSFPAYHLYTIERYRSFQAASRRGDGPREVADEEWYDEGVRYLLKSQQRDGGWSLPEGPVPGTGFAALFLLRATRRTLESAPKIGAGTLVGGRGLPKADEPPARGPNPAAKPPGPAAEMAALVRRLDDPQFLAALSAAETQGRVADAPPPDELRKRLVALAKSDSPDAQAAALTALSRTNDLDHVPLLIESLLDPRPQVHQAACDALRYLARESNEIGRPLPADEPSRLAEASRRRAWFQSIRPPAK
jgi:hypothetical protein